MFNPLFEGSAGRRSLGRGLCLSILAHLCGFSILSLAQLIHLSTIPLKFVTVVQAAGPKPVHYGRYELKLPSRIESPRSVRSLPSLPEPTAVPLEIPSEIEGLLDVPVGDLSGSLPRTAAPLLDQPLTVEPPAPYTDRVAVVPPVESPGEDPPIKIGGRVQQAEPITRVPPVYPRAARQARVQGTVVIHGVVSPTGVLERLEVISGHPMLIQAAMECVRQWRYRPGTLNESPIEMPIVIRVNFVLKFGEGG